MTLQRTIARPATCAGTGLHTGETATVRFVPAPPNTGIVFVRTDLPMTDGGGRPKIPALAPYRIAQPRRTAIMCGEAEVHTVEHMISAAVGLGIDNLEIELAGPEAPGFDGSAAEYVRVLKAAGLEEQDAPRRELTVTEPIKVEGDNGAELTALPNPAGGLRLTYTLDYPVRPLRNVRVEFDVTEDRYASEIAPARTFVLKEEAEMLKALGLGAGASLDNTLVFDDDSPIGGVQLRFPDEAARHKVLDLVGDLAILGSRLNAHVIAVKSGHELNLALVMELLVRTC
jgi:UDP-3-O-[3-hydroxymyristoyl] N-acetylglucosamine deacetylase / 3-hydroxyacyl-[acyl-carrier-protein] dehydratase